jgi:hypothetical protein
LAFFLAERPAFGAAAVEPRSEVEVGVPMPLPSATLFWALIFAILWVMAFGVQSEVH